VVIYKYEVSPEGAQILSVSVQDGEPYIWALVDPGAPKEEHHFKILPTGMPFDPDGLTYIGSFHGVGAWMVLHLFAVSQIPALTSLEHEENRRVGNLPSVRGE
jgi:hypothetical protein